MSLKVDPRDRRRAALLPKATLHLGALPGDIVLMFDAVAILYLLNNSTTFTTLEKHLMRFVVGIIQAVIGIIAIL